MTGEEPTQTPQSPDFLRVLGAVIAITLIATCLIFTVGAVGGAIAGPTKTPHPTFTPWPRALEFTPESGAAAPCQCGSDSVSCSDASATACFSYCRSQGRGDVHNLDGDGDGLACE